jgi:hypothetical protein
MSDRPFQISTFSRCPRGPRKSVDSVLEAAWEEETLGSAERVWGLDVERLFDLHDRLAADARQKVRTGRGVALRSIRRDTHTLLRVTAFYPLEWREVRKTGVEDGRHSAWIDRTAAFFRGVLGRDLKSVVEIVSGKSPILHLYAIPQSQADMRAIRIHPGKVAKAAAEEEARSAGASTLDAIRAGDHAYRSTMAALQSRFRNDVLLHLGVPEEAFERMRPGASAGFDAEILDEVARRIEAVEARERRVALAEMRISADREAARSDDRG